MLHRIKGPAPAQVSETQPSWSVAGWLPEKRNFVSPCPVLVLTSAQEYATNQVICTTAGLCRLSLPVAYGVVTGGTVRHQERLDAGAGRVIAIFSFLRVLNPV